MPIDPIRNLYLPHPDRLILNLSIGRIRPLDIHLASAQPRYPIFFLLGGYPFRLPPQFFHIPTISSLAFRLPTTLILLAFILVIFILPSSLLKHRPPRCLLRLSRLLFRSLLVQALFLPLRKGLWGDGREYAGELVALGFEEVFEGEGFEGGFVEKGFFGGPLLFGFEDEAIERRVWG